MGYCKPITPADQHFCKYCKHLIEDEIHFLVVYPTFKKIGTLHFDNFDKNNYLKKSYLSSVL